MGLSPGSRLGPYQIVSAIGAGGMGEVYRATDPRLGREVAIKVLPERLLQDSEALSRFEREARAVAALSHPNILAIHDFGREGGAAYAVTELLDGETLRARLDRESLTGRQALDYALQIAKGLSAAHERGVVHRDLKPENLFITRTGDVKILDFGLAKRFPTVSPGEETSAPTVTGQTTPGTVMGTLGYMSPEQLRGLPVDHRTDLFSFGVVLYEMVSGERAFRGSSDVAVADAILHAEPRDFGGKPVPSKLRSIIRRLLEKDPAKRYPSAVEVHSELKVLEASLDAAPRRRLSRGAAAAIAGAGLVIAVAGAWLWRRSSRERWALETAAPEIARLTDAGDNLRAAALAQRARAILPRNPTLEKLWMKVTGEATVDTVPPGADTLVRPCKEETGDWKRLGKTPLKGTRVPDVCFVWRIEKPGFAPLWFLDSPVVNWNVKLHPAASAPPDMVFVPGDEARLGVPLAWHAPRVRVEDFFIDRHEVTNEDYKKFVDAGGYRKREFWKQPFVRDGRPIAWEEGIALLYDSTGRPGPAAWEAGAFPSGQQKHPVGGVSWYEAAAYAEFRGKSLPTIYHWTLASQPLFAEQIVPGSNFRGAGTRPVDAARTLSGFGTTDMAGNVKEWCWNEGQEEKRFILGGGFGEPIYMFQQTDSQSPWDRRPNYGFRCVKLSSPSPAAAARIEVSVPDFSQEKPVSDEVARAYSGLYAYEKGELNARVEERVSSEDWIREKVTFDAAYGGERVPAHLFLPKNASAPFQTVVYFPGAYAMFQDHLDVSLTDDLIEFLPKSGRALLFPIYKSTYERQDAFKPPRWKPPLFRDHIVLWSKDVGRSVDYLQTRKDIDVQRLGYVGFSWGAHLGPVFLAVDDRFRAAILISGGFQLRNDLPEANAFNFAPRVKLPVLMLNGRYDDMFPVEKSQLPLFRGLGTPENEKRHVVYDTGHGDVPHREIVRETLDWLDKYLGPVKR